MRADVSERGAKSAPGELICARRLVPAVSTPGPGTPSFHWEPLDVAAAAKNKLSLLLRVLFHTYSIFSAFHVLSRRKVDLPVAAAAPLLAPWQLAFICMAGADVGQKRQKSLPHLLVWSRGDGWMGTAMKRPPSFPPLPPRNRLSVQFLPHVRVSHPSPSPSICSWTAFLPAAVSLQPLHLAVANSCQRLCVIYTMTSPPSNEYEHIRFSLASWSLVCLPRDKLTR